MRPEVRSEALRSTAVSALEPEVIVLHVNVRFELRRISLRVLHMKLTSLSGIASGSPGEKR
jgi:hypothetical protein